MIHSVFVRLIATASLLLFASSGSALVPEVAESEPEQREHPQHPGSFPRPDIQETRKQHD